MNPSETQQQTRTANEINAIVDRTVLRQVKQMEDDGIDFNASMLTSLTQRYGKGDMAEETKKELMEQLKLVGSDADSNTA